MNRENEEKKKVESEDEEYKYPFNYLNHQYPLNNISKIRKKWALSILFVPVSPHIFFGLIPRPSNMSFVSLKTLKPKIQSH